MPVQLRFEVFPADLEATRDFYTRVLGFVVMRYQHEPPGPYLAMQRDEVRVGAAPRDELANRAERRPPTGAELVLEVDDVHAEHDRVCAAGWPVEEALQTRPWGLVDFRLLDPSGYYLRITGR